MEVETAGTWVTAARHSDSESEAEEGEEGEEGEEKDEEEEEEDETRGAEGCCGAGEPESGGVARSCSLLRCFFVVLPPWWGCPGRRCLSRVVVVAVVVVLVVVLAVTWLLCLV